ncbi:MAG: M23 family metallopeptidase [Alphaproteobacteria bacterium]|nr:M23 family metallopeptidase [Alphaproteobacteria bacterium]MDE2042679.1 M23 family metallopeptidase [Alphaproteobacteria bacterium]MDE2339831.1 M23 family metallopeptidase [Alphaproteobacteria bacterium]
MFRTRDIFIRDGAELRRVTLTPRTQLSALAGGFLGMMALIGMPLAAAAEAGSTGVLPSFAGNATQTEQRVAHLQAEVQQIRVSVKAHVAMLDRRDALLAAIIAGKGDANKLAALDAIEVPAAQSKLASDVRGPLNATEARQLALATSAQNAIEARVAQAQGALNRLHLAPTRFKTVQGGMGGPYEPVDEKAIAAGENSFHNLFQSWKKLDQLQQGSAAIPAIRPVDRVSFTSNFGVRTDPFNGHRAMHAGVDIPGAYGTNIYATADGVVNRAGWVNGYGNLVEINHGRGIMTRYGHLSSFVVAAGQRVTRGQLIAHMGSTGRSTGNHLHYEVRIDGNAVNPVPFLQSSDYLMALQLSATPRGQKVAMGGPEESAD